MDFKRESDETIQFFCSNYVEALKGLLAAAEKQRNLLIEQYGNPSPIKNLNVTPLAKILMFTKSLAKRVAISAITGVKPMYLSDGIGDEMEEAKLRTFSGVVATGYLILTDLINGINKTIEMLELSSLETKQQLLNGFDGFYQETVKYPLKHEIHSFERISMYLLSNYLKVVSLKSFNRSKKFLYSGHTLEVDYNIIAAIQNVYKQYEEKKLNARSR